MQFFQTGFRVSGLGLGVMSTELSPPATEVGVSAGCGPIFEWSSAGRATPHEFQKTILAEPLRWRCGGARVTIGVGRIANMIPLWSFFVVVLQ